LAADCGCIESPPKQPQSLAGEIKKSKMVQKCSMWIYPEHL